MNVKEQRIKTGLSQQELANKTGIPKDRIGKWEQGKGSPKGEDTKTLEKFFDEYVPRENPKNGNADKNQPVATNGSQNFIQARREQKNVSREFMVPLVPVKAQAGYAMSYPDTQHYSESLEKYPMLPGISHHGAEWRYFEVEGDSMIPTLFDKDYILVSAVLKEDWQDVKPNKPYVVVLHEDVFVKFIYQVDLETWILASANRKVKHKKISVEDVKELWVFRGRTTKNLDIPKIEIKV